MKRIMYVVLAIAAIAGVFALTNNKEKEGPILSEKKPETTETQQSEEEKKKAEEAAKAAAENFSYVAQNGDSYTLMARKAVQTYIADAKESLSEAQIVYAETNLTQLSNSPYLNISQNVSIAKANVKDWVQKAKTLTAEQQARWNVYAQYANFNTASVGVAR